MTKKAVKVVSHAMDVKSDTLGSEVMGEAHWNQVSAKR